MRPLNAELRVSCDSMVALGNSTADGNTIFAKNSDRPALECQPLLQIASATHQLNTQLRCTYLDIPQSRITHRVVGSRPYWCWGFEHGVNEHGVAIGNHTVFSKAPLVGTGLIGMDLVRLGLERSGSASAAVETITALLSEFGQGGSGYADKEWPYHNSFLIADPQTAFLLETSDRDWACKRVTDVASLSNHISIAADWDQLSSTALEHALAAGWWRNAQQRLDFASAYRDTTMAPEVISSGRYGRSCSLLATARGTISLTTMRATLRDHYGMATPSAYLTPIDERYFSICMHAEPVGTTTASMIATLPRTPATPLIYWASLGSPCVGAFLPLFVLGDIPPVLAKGGEHPEPDSPWWVMKQLLQWVECDWQARHPPVRAAMDELETRFQRDVISIAVADSSEFMKTTVADLLELAGTFTAR